MNTEEWFEKAQAYFNGSMTIDDSQLFEEETAASKELSHLMQLWKMVDEQGSLFEQSTEYEERFRATHQRVRNLLTEERRTVKINFPAWKWVAIAATVAGIVILMNIFTPTLKENSSVAEQKSKSKDTNKIITKDPSVALTDTANKDIQTPPGNRIDPKILYAQQFSPDEVPEDVNGPLNNAFFYYASAQYKRAIVAIDSAGKNSVTRGGDSFASLTKFYASYYKALSMLSLGNDAGAVPLLEQSMVIAPSAYLKGKAQWYLALTLLKQGNTLSASNNLQALSENDAAGSYRQKAKKLLSVLNR